jgi:hypothetical protein
MSHRTCVAQYLSDPTTRQRYVVLDEMFCRLLTEWLVAQDTVLTWEHLPTWPGCTLDEYLTLTAVLERLAQHVGYPLTPGESILPLLQRVAGRLQQERDAMP